MTTLEHDQDIEKFSGSELDDSEETDAVDVAGEADGVDITEKVKALLQAVRPKSVRFVWMIGIVGCILVVFGGMLLYLMHSMRFSNASTDPVSQSNRRVIRLPVQQEQSIFFEDFVIPAGETHTFTYVSFSMGVAFQNDALKREMIRRKHQIRCVIYDNLRDKIDAAQQVPTIKQLKRIIRMTLNDNLSSGSISDVYVTDFLAV